MTEKQEKSDKTKKKARLHKVLVTGVAGGIGAATAELFGDEGWYVIGVDRRFVDAPPGVSRFIRADVSDPDAAKMLFEEVADEEKYLDAIVNNAAIQVCVPIVEMDVYDWDRTMASNMRSCFLTTKYGYPLMKGRDAAIVNVSSVHAVATSANIAAYASSKGALLAFTRATAIELAGDKIRVNAVLPGAVDTPMLHAGLMRGHLAGTDVQSLMDDLGSRTVQGRVGQPREIAQAILFVADHTRSSFMTGQALIVDGGATCRLSTE
jgi:NAD(P)-dependent dehydrogenase (short-subunit alcohol dehydrogenase family)